MELIDKIKEILSELKLENPIFDLNYDKSKNIFGYIYDPIYEGDEDERYQKEIWECLKNGLSTEEFVKILSIIPENKDERLKRVFNSTPLEKITHKFFMHETPEKDKYWVIIDVTKTEDAHKAIMILSNYNRKINQANQLIYSKEMIEFMELNQEDIYDELVTNAYNNIEGKLVADLMKRHNDIESKGVFGKENRFLYTYQDFHLASIAEKEIYFDNTEIQFFEDWYHVLDEYSIIDDLKKRVEVSKMKLKLTQEIKPSS